MAQRTIKNLLSLSFLSAGLAFHVNSIPLSSLLHPLVPHLPQETLDDVIITSLATALTFGCSFVAFVLFFMFMDLSGRWEQYLLEKKNRKVTWKTYMPGLENFLFDFLFFLLPLNLLLFILHRDTLLSSPLPSTLNLAFLGKLTSLVGKLVIGYFVGKLWSYVAHYLLHKKAVYRYVHKLHHVPTTEMVASHAWFETIPEFFVMEMPNLLLGIFLFPVPWKVLLFYYVYHAFGAASDHSGFKVNWLIDAEFHYRHHKQQVVNFAEMESIDLFFGTHHSVLEKETGKKGFPTPSLPSSLSFPISLPSLPSFPSWLWE